MKIHFQRQALYEQVWTTPLSKLGPQYGISDNGLRKVCRAMNIPVPGRGYWAARAAGQDVEPASLSPEANRFEYSAEVPGRRRRQDDCPEDWAWFEERMARDADPRSEVKFSIAPARWHPLIQPLREWMTAAVKARQRRLEAERLQVLRGKKAVVQPKVIHPTLFSRDDGILRNRVGASCMLVSHVTCDRGLAIANALLFAAEKRGCIAHIDEKAGRFVLQLEGAVLKFAVRERQESGEQGGRVGRRPTDRIALVMEIPRNPGQYEILDRQDAPVESRLIEVFPRLYRAVLASRAEARKVAERDARSAAYEQSQEKEAKSRRLSEEASRIAELRKLELVQEARSRRDAVLIREYVSAVLERAQAESLSNEDLVEWLRWALDTSDELDPVGSRLLAILRGHQVAISQKTD
ncbi:hypothetical protein [Variovorax atrisoli]|uniref:hypothetical protein n=1 Tax=Variovorax atrisoli TaxID=3394203 RepID=UPI00119BBF08|nr:hypothetical protein [Variovorax paradoxus]